MKFILNESNKFILDERFILTEAEILDIAKSWTDKVKAELPTVKDILQKMVDNAKPSSGNGSAAEYDNLLKDLNEKSDAVKKSRRLPGASDELKSDLTAYYTAFKKVFDAVYEKRKNKVAPDSVTEFTDEFNAFQKLISTDPWNESTKKKALNIFDNLFSLLKNLFGETALTASGNTEEKINALKNACKQADETIDTINDKYLNIDLSKMAENDLNAYAKILETTLIQIIDKIKTVNITGTLRTIQVEKYTEFVNKMNTALHMFMESAIVKSKIDADRAKEAEDIAKEAKAARQKEIEDELNATKSKYDWAKIYNSLDTPEKREAFWDGNPNMEQPFKEGYYKIEWGENAKKIKDLGIAFINTLTKIGWDAILNPFIYFLKQKISDKRYRLNERTFTQLYNAVAKNQLTLNDLKGTGIFKKYNIIFNPKTFDLGQELPEYFALQNEIKTKAHNLDAPLLEKYKKGNQGLMLANFMYIEGDMVDFLSPINEESGTFRSITDIQRLITMTMGEKDENEKIDVTNDVIDTIVNDIEKDDIKEILAFLTVVWLTDGYTTQLNAVDSAFDGQLYANKAVNLTPTIINACIKKLQLNNYKYSPKTVTDLLTKLMEKAGFTKKK